MFFEPYSYTSQLTNEPSKKPYSIVAHKRIKSWEYPGGLEFSDIQWAHSTASCFRVASHLYFIQVCLLSASGL